jgi:phytoene synthase
MDSSFEHCQRLVAEIDRDRFLATLFAPADKRGALFALYAFNAEITRVRELARQPLPGEIRLQWWREVLGGERAGEAAAHPVAAAVLDTLKRYAIAPAPLLALIDAHSFDLYDEPMARLADLADYSGKTSATLLAIGAQILGGRGASVDTLAMHSGLAYGYAGLLSGFARHAARRQLYLPLELLDRCGADRNDIVAGKTSPQLLAALADMRALVRHHLAAANALLAEAPAAILPALLPVALVRVLLAGMDKPGYDPFRPNELPAWRRQWLLWRAARDQRRIFA